METPRLCTHTRVCVRIHGPAYVARVPEAMKSMFFALKIEVRNESHII